MVYGAGYTDMYVMLWVYRLLVLLSAAAAVIVIVGLKKKQFKKILVVPAVMIVFALISGGVAPLVQNFIVSPNSLAQLSARLRCPSCGGGGQRLAIVSTSPVRAAVPLHRHEVRLASAKAGQNGNGPA